MLRLTTLGAIDLRDRLGHQVRDVLAQSKRIALLAYLALESRRGPVSRDRLLALFWPEADAARARNSLSQALHHLRLALGADVIESHGVTALAVRTSELWCDAVVFGEAVERGELDLALDLYRGEFCPGLFTRGAPDLEQWLDAERRRFRRQAIAAGRARAEQLAALGDQAAAGRSARRALGLHPDDEGDVRALLQLLENAGDRAGALVAYQEYADRLSMELETTPSSETRRMADAMRRRQDPAIGDAGAGPLGNRGPVASPRVHRRRPVLVTLAVLLLLAVGAAATLKARARRPAPPAVRTVAVLPFTLRGGAPFSYLSEGMVDLLSAKLDGSAAIRTIDPRSVLAAVARRDPGDEVVEATAEIARTLGAGWYISGDVVEVAGRFQLTGSLVDVRSGSRTVATATVAGDTASLLQLVDDLAGQMLARVLPGGRDTTLTQLAAVTTHSLPALRRFLDGEQALREGHDARAAAAFREAVSLDSTFALAQYRLALMATWVNVPDADSPLQWAALATRHAGRLTPLARDLLTAYVAYKELRAPMAERLYRNITVANPDNVEAWFMLGETLFHYNFWRGRSPMEAWSAFQKVLALDPNNSHAILHLARLAALHGRNAELDSLTARYLARYSDAERTLEIRALRAWVSNDPAERRAVATEARTADGTVLMSLVQSALLLAQNLGAVDDLIEAVGTAPINPYHRQFLDRYFTDLPLVAGRWTGVPANGGRSGDGFDSEAWRLEVRALLATDPRLPISREHLAVLRDSVAIRRAYPSLTPPLLEQGPNFGPLMQRYLLGLLSARLGDLPAATKLAAELASERDSAGSAVATDLARGIRAEIARSRADYPQVLIELERFQFDAAARVRSLAHWGQHERFLMAEALEKVGRKEAALVWYQSFMGTFDAPFLAPANLRMAEIYRQLGNRERATFHGGRAQALWGDADPALRAVLNEGR